MVLILASLPVLGARDCVYRVNTGTHREALSGR